MLFKQLQVVGESTQKLESIFFLHLTLIRDTMGEVIKQSVNWQLAKQGVSGCRLMGNYWP